MKKNHFLKPAPKSLKPSKFHKKSGGNRKFKGYIFFAFCFLLSLFLSLCFSCVCCFLFVFSLFFFGGVVLSCFICVFFNCYLFLDQCRKTVCPPRPFIKCLKVSQFSINWPGRCHWVTARRKKKKTTLQSATVFWDVSTNWPGSSHRVTARRTKKNLYNLPRCFAKITDFKKCKKKEFIKYPPKWALCTRTWLALYRPLSKGGKETIASAKRKGRRHARNYGFYKARQNNICKKL